MENCNVKMQYNKDLSYINNDNYKLILDRINYVINNAHTTNQRPYDIIELINIRTFIYTKFIDCLSY